MAYCTVADVQAQLPKVTLTADSDPSTADVEGYISQIESQIRGVLSGAGYDDDPTDIHALEYLELTCTLGSAALTERAAFPGKDFWKELWDMYMANLESIRKGEAPGLTFSSGGGQALPESLYTVDAGATQAAKFKIGSEQW